MTTRSRVLRAAAVLAASAAWNAAGVAQGAQKATDLEYAEAGGQALKLDLYLPKAHAPLLVWLHGGRWEVGSKERMPLSALVERGYAIASLDFRPASRARFPGQVHDIKAALRYLRARAPEYGYDATRIGILGESSGGHLAALVGTTNGRAELEGSLGEHLGVSSEVHAIVSYFGASDLLTILAQSTPYGQSIREPALYAAWRAPERGGRAGATREPGIPDRRPRSAAAPAARRSRPADADQPVPRRGCVWYAPVSTRS
jgi:hypothetical protein